MTSASCRVVAVFLGDSHAGKTALIKAIAGNETCDPSAPFSPTIGAECYSTNVTYHGRAVELVLWDYGGSERFAPPLGASTVQAHVCCLVADLTDRQSLPRLKHWRDEFAQSSASFAAPAFVIAGTKADIADSVEGQRGISKSELEAFAAAESNGSAEKDDVMWPREAAGTASVVPPVVEVSSASSVSLATAIAGLKEQLIFRGLVEQAASIVIQDRVDIALAGSVAPKMAYETIKKQLSEGTVAIALHGAIAPPTSIFGPVGDSGVFVLARDSTTPWNVMAWSTNYTGTQYTPSLYRMMRVVVLLVEISDKVNVNVVRQLKEEYCERANLRDVASLVWIVMGVANEHKSAPALELLESHCRKERLPFIEVPFLTSNAMRAEIWATMTQRIQDEHVSIVMRRAEEQLTVAATSCPNGACPWVGRVCDVEHHLTTCPKQVVQCRWDKCTHLSFREQRETHEKFCVLRPATCHFCEQAYDGTLVEHLVFCRKREEFDRTHVACPMADYGCNTTHVLRGELQTHLAQEVTPHLELLCTATTHLRKLLLEQERRHLQSMEAMHAQHLSAVAALTLRLEDTQAVVKKQHDTILEANLEFKLVWEELQSLKQQRQSPPAASQL